MTTLAQWQLAAQQSLLADGALEARLMLEAVTGLTSTQQRMYPERMLTTEELTQLNTLLARRHQGEPMAYLLGMQPFYTLDLQVNKHTLIPRPETEHLIICALEKIMPLSHPVIADLGTGSGAIALSLASERSDACILALDRSVEALHVAYKNAKRHQIGNVMFVATDWGSALQSNSFDLIVSNPPYIAPNDEHLQALVYEPQSALVADCEGYADLIRIIDEAPRLLKPSRWLLLEHGYQQAEKLHDYAQQYSYWYDITTLKDHSGHDRVTMMRYNP